MVHLGMQITILELNSQVSFVFWWSNRLWQPAEHTVSVIVTAAPVRITLCWQHWEEGKQMQSPVAFKHSGKGWKHRTLSAGHSPVAALQQDPGTCLWMLNTCTRHRHRLLISKRTLKCKRTFLKTEMFLGLCEQHQHSSSSQQDTHPCHPLEGKHYSDVICL